LIDGGKVVYEIQNFNLENADWKIVMKIIMHRKDVY